MLKHERTKKVISQTASRPFVGGAKNENEMLAEIRKFIRIASRVRTRCEVSPPSLVLELSSNEHG